MHCYSTRCALFSSPFIPQIYVLTVTAILRTPKLLATPQNRATYTRSYVRRLSCIIHSRTVCIIHSPANHLDLASLAQPSTNHDRITPNSSDYITSAHAQCVSASYIQLACTPDRIEGPYTFHHVPEFGDQGHSYLGVAGERDKWAYHANMGDT